MPISEDEYDHGQHHGMSKAEQRRSNKPIMEKRRRARINHCLNELKSLILDAMKKDPARHSKLEKADILELTVKHLQGVQRQQLAAAVAGDPAVLHRFRSGFSECAGEVGRYVGRLDGVETAVKHRLVAHLAHCVAGLQQLTPLAAAFAPPPPQATPNPAPNATPTPTAGGDVNNNPSALQGVPLLPGRLPTGELALLLPGGTNLQGLPFFPAVPPPPSGVPTTVAPPLADRSHPSAFTAVDQRPRSRGAAHSDSSGDEDDDDDDDNDDDGSVVSEAYLSANSPPPPPQMPANRQQVISDVRSERFDQVSPSESFKSRTTYSHPKSPPPTSAITMTVPEGILSSEGYKHRTSYLSNSPPPTAKSPPSGFKPRPTYVSTLVNTSAAMHMGVLEPSRVSVAGLVPRSSNSVSVETTSSVIVTSPQTKSTTSVDVGTVTEVKVEFKTFPVHGNVFPVITTSAPVSSLPRPTTTIATNLPTVAPTSSLHQPLSIITSQPDVPSYKPISLNVSANPIVTFPVPVAKDPPLDFSIKRDDPPLVQSISTQTSSSLGAKRSLPANFSITDQSDPTVAPLFSPPNKLPRYSLQIKTDSELPLIHPSPLLHEPPLEQTSNSLLKVVTPKHLYPNVGEDLTNKPAQSSTSNTSTNTSSSGSSESSQSANKDMWRPW